MKLTLQGIHFHFFMIIETFHAKNVNVIKRQLIFNEIFHLQTVMS